MADKVEYEIFNVPLKGRNLIASRMPRVQPSVPEEYADFLSREVAMGDWSVDEKGEAINSKGQNLQQHCEFTISTRAHWLAPVILEDPSSDCWLEGNITKQGERLKHLRKYTGSDAAALVLLREEAAAHGVKVFTTEKGTKPGSEKVPEGKKSAGPLSQNPWAPEYLKRHSPAEALAEQTRLIRLGSALARNTAKAAGVSVFGAPLK